MTAWIMVDSNGMPSTRNMYFLYDGFRELGEVIKTYTPADVLADSLPYTKNDIVVGHIDHCRRHVKQITGEDVPVIDYPKELDKYLGRSISKSTVGEVYNKILTKDEYGFFIKPVSQKSFTGFVCARFADFSNNCGGHDKDEPVFISDVIKFVSEYRVYIHRHDIVGCLRYKGDWSKAPNRQTVEDMLDSLKNANMPVAYSIDVGVTDTGETLLVECNDGFALGNYGLPSREYAEMHRDRWNQLVRNDL